MKERKIVKGDRVYIDNSNIIYKVADIQYSGNRIVYLTVYYKDLTTQEEKIIPVNPTSVRLF
jgi:hypothetical protein